MQDDAVNGMEETVKKSAVIEKKVSEVLIYSKDAVSVLNVNEFERHLGSSFHGIFIAACRAETAVASERDIFKVATMGTSVHGTAVGRVAAVDHFFNVFQFAFTWVEGVSDLFKIFTKNLL